ncbi:malonic semialdehyde reductase [Vibrio rarus]|uniref:malonic semialdehyde reductase n=1 Tax=Vibrio rarus TaxID=413403 RepID=UPI0021C2815B|nr:malonic semialdehyde reductase [Vibrio rarus]
MNLDKVRLDAQQRVTALRQRKSRLDKDSIDLILNDARSHYAWQDKAVPATLLEEMYQIVANGATSMNCCPARFYFVTSEQAKQQLALSLKEKNIDKMLAAPVTVIIAHDLDFWKQLPFLFPHEDRRPLFQDKPAYIERTAFLNGTLQGAYLMIAARALGLDVGPMSGFSNDIVDQTFFAGTTLRSNFLCNLGYADESALFQKLPRFEFSDVCTYL